MINTKTRVAARIRRFADRLAVALSTTSASASTSNYLASNITGHRDGCQRRREGDDEDQVGIDDGRSRRCICLMSDGNQESFPLAQNVRISKSGRTIPRKPRTCCRGRYL